MFFDKSRPCVELSEIYFILIKKGFILHKIFIFLICFYLSATASAFEIGVIKSHNLSIYDKVVQGIKIESKGKILIYDMRNNRIKAKEVIESVKSKKFPLLITIGPTASLLVRKELPDTPMIFSMIPTPIYLKSQKMLKAKNVTGVTLELPIKTQLNALKSIAPKTKLVGVLYNPKYTSNIVNQSKTDAESLNIKMLPSRVDDADEIEEATTAFTGRVDAIWMIPDRTLLNKKSYSKLLEYTFKNKVPFFAFSERMVEKGALVSLSADYTQIGRQLGKVTNQVLIGGKNLGDFPIEVPESLDLAINLSTAKRIGVECDIALEVFTFAAMNNFPIKVYK